VARRSVMGRKRFRIALSPQGDDLHTSRAEALSPPLATPGLPEIARACGEELEMGWRRIERDGAF